MMRDKYWTLDEIYQGVVIERYGLNVGKPTLRAWMSRKGGPKAVGVGFARPRYSVARVINWLESTILVEGSSEGCKG